MTTASEVFVLQLARASLRANKFLRVRHMRIDDRNDVIANALLWCWENRASYPLTATVEQWFLSAIKHAYRDWLNGEARNSAEAMAEIPSGDDTIATVQAHSAVRALMRALPRAYRRVAIMQMQGFTRAEMMEKGVSERTISAARERIKQLRRLIPETSEYRHVLRTMPAAAPDELAQPGTIDREIEQLEFAPPAGKECPPCWRCRWYDGFLPQGKKSIKMETHDEDVRIAIQTTEKRKIEIARWVRG